MRTNAIIFAPFLENPNVIRNQLMHVADLLPTLARIAGIKLGNDLDGVNQMDVINHGCRQVRDEIVNVDDVLGFGCYISYPYKLVNGTLFNASYDGWLSTSGPGGDNDPINYALNVLNSTVSRAIFALPNRISLSVDQILAKRAALTVRCSSRAGKTACDLRKGPCVFDIFADPCEQNNLAIKNPALLDNLMWKYQSRIPPIAPTRRRKPDPACDPINFDMNWQWWESDS